jgi:acetyl-CoA acetyltransferase family protein
MGKLGGQLALVRPDDLAAHAIRLLMERNPDLDPMAIEDIQWGAANQAGEDNRNVARMAGLLAGLPIEVSGVTVNRLCGSGMQAVISAGHALAGGWGDVMIAGGSESMSRAPYVISKAERGFPTGLPDSADTVLGWRLVNPEMERLYPPITLGMTAEVVADKYEVSRDDQDGFALASHQKSVAAVAADRFSAEIEPIEVPVDHRRRATTTITHDEGPRRDTSLEALARLSPVFKEGGTVTAGNAPGVNDGAAALVVCSAERAGKLGRAPLARIVAQATSGLDPSLVMMTPVPAVQKLWKRTGWSASTVDLYELNEAFAVQSVAVSRELGIDTERVNVNGGAVALGHPIGASGARVLTTLLYALRDRGRKRGIAALCLGGGNGVGLAVEIV